MVLTTVPDRVELMRTFVRIVEAGSLSAAARQLNTTQPTVSRRLKTLEQQLGIRLINRSTHQFRLTEVGERYYQGARELLEHWDRFDSELTGTLRDPEGTLRVIAPHAFGQEALVGPLADFMRRYPRLSVEWLLHDDRSIHDFIAENIDCAIQVGEVTDANMVAIKIAEVPRLLAAAPSVVAAAGPLNHPRQLENQPWLALQTFYRRQLQLKHCRSQAEFTLDLTPRFYTDSLYALRSAAIEGIGFCVGSQWLLKPDIHAGLLQQVCHEWQLKPLPVYILYPYARFYPAKLRLFVDEMRQQMPAMIHQLTEI
ncbi:LysR family transcriptional regulator [Celerinatantimonas sp. YJH-8]|uniref:LysR family transcriptional regulator n=1 Tax=Celerinatantimonas sp. YJH-8 TaxID=3228714 RepID=UPI0038C15139